MNNSVAVIGGGAAGLMCAGLAAEFGASVTLFEKNKSEKKLDREKFFDNAYLGKKLLITGKGRCNVTNACTKEEFMSAMTCNGKFLYAAYNAFPSEKTMELFEDAGVPLKVERGNRVFPVTDKAADILYALKSRLKNFGVKVVNKKVCGVEKQGDEFVLTCEDGKKHSFSKAVICTGGLSYPVTGSDGDGYEFAKSLGHTVTELVPSLVPLECVKHEMCSGMSGLSLKNVKLTMVDKTKNKPVYSEMGEMLFTHFGISGPLVLSASAHMRKQTADNYRADIDLKPALDLQTIEAKLIKLFELDSNKNMSNVLRNMLPSGMTEYFCEYCGLSPEIKPNSVTKQQRRVIAEAFKKFSLDISSFRPIAEAIITSGGVNVKEINPSTMESKLVPGLYFAGEIIDLDAYTGGFNLQIAFSTAYVAAKSVSGAS